MDEELRGYLAAMEGRLADSLAAGGARLEAWGTRLEAEQVKLRGELNAIEGRLMERFNNSEERILNRLATMEGDALNTKGFLLNDAVVSGRRWFDLEARVTKPEDDKP
jgi:hypothetical protein